MLNTQEITLRDYFAGQVLSGMMAGGFMPCTSENPPDYSPEGWAKKAFSIADAMLEARKPLPTGEV